jgi:hypothetical protein
MSTPGTAARVPATPARTTRPAHPSRWPAGTLAAAGTIPGPLAARPSPALRPPTPCRLYHRLPPARVKGACGVAKASAPRPCDPGRRSHDRSSYQGKGLRQPCPKTRHQIPH